MKPFNKISIIVFMVVIVFGLGMTGMVRVRHVAARMECRNNLKQIGLALWAHYDVQQHFPTGVVFKPELPPEKRLSWIVQIHPFVQGGVGLLSEAGKAMPVKNRISESTVPRFVHGRIIEYQLC